MSFEKPKLKVHHGFSWGDPVSSMWRNSGKNINAATNGGWTQIFPCPKALCLRPKLVSQQRLSQVNTFKSLSHVFILFSPIFRMGPKMIFHDTQLTCLNCPFCIPNICTWVQILNRSSQAKTLRSIQECVWVNVCTKFNWQATPQIVFQMFCSQTGGQL